ncbi:MucB/RseB C-terminal domain-containing protein [Pseudaquabacterium terrae]|nr:MucB/RseB C-terminal domain-containing protein [Aquabacterium terrae]
MPRVSERRLFGRLGVGVMLLSCATLAGAQAAADPAQWLSRMRQAATNRTYQGTMAFAAGSQVSSSRVTHISEGRERYERIEALDGQMRQQFRHNGALLTLWPQTRVAIVEQVEPIADFPALPASSQRALESYEIRSIGSDRVAGHEAEVLLLKPRDALRFGQRLWAERETGLLLRTEVLSPRGDVLESASFTDLSIGGKLAPESVLKPMKKKLDGYRVVRPQAQPTQLDAEGWSLKGSVPGFQLLNCVKRPLDAADEAGAELQVLQSVFSDGLTHVSVFIERFDAQRHKPMRTMLGATHSLMNRHGDWWVTIVGDVPMATIQQFEALLQRRP